MTSVVGKVEQDDEEWSLQVDAGPPRHLTKGGLAASAEALHCVLASMMV